MNTKKLPYFNVYPKDFITDASYNLLTWEERGVLIDLRHRYWINGSLPSDPAKLARICGGKTELFQRVLPKLKAFFRDKNGVLKCKELDKQYNALKTYQQKQSERGKKGAEARWRDSEKDEKVSKKRQCNDNKTNNKDGGRISKQCPPSISSSSTIDIRVKKEKDSCVKSYKDFTTLNSDHQDFAETFLKNIKTEYPTYYGGLIKRYKNEADCDARQLASYLDTIDKLQRLDKYSFDEIVTAAHWAMKDEFWQEQFKTLRYLRDHKKGKPAYISIFLSKASRSPEAQRRRFQAKMKALDERDRKQLKGGT